MTTKKFLVTFSMLAGLSILVSCGKKLESQTIRTEEAAESNGNTVASTTTAPTTVTPVSPTFGQTCFIPVDLAGTTPTELQNFFYPSPRMNPNTGGYFTADYFVPHKNGDLTFCLVYSDTVSPAVAQIRFEYLFQDPTDANYYITSVNLKNWSDASDPFKYSFFSRIVDNSGSSTADELELMWFDNERFVSLKASEVSTDQFQNAVIRFGVLPIFGPGNDSRGATNQQEKACVEGSEFIVPGGSNIANISAAQCARTKVFSWEFFRQVNEDARLYRNSGIVYSDQVGFIGPTHSLYYEYDAAVPMTNAWTNRVVNMARRIIEPPNTGFENDLSALGIRWGVLGTSTSIDLAAARTASIVNRD